MISGINNSAKNIFANSSDMTSRLRASGSTSSESGYRDLSRKDIRSVTSIKKDEVEYEIDKMMYDQKKSLDDEEWDRIGDMFK